MVRLRALDLRQVSGQAEQQPVERHPHDADHEAVGRDREQRPRLADAAQVHRHQHHDEHRRDDRLVAGEGRDRGRGVLDARRDRHRHGQHVVDEQRGTDRDAGGLAEVDGRDLVVATAARVGVHVLAVRRDDGQHHDRDRDADLPRPDVGGGAGQRQHDEDLVGGVGDRRERVAGEDRERDRAWAAASRPAGSCAACVPAGSAWRRRRHPRAASVRTPGPGSAANGVSRGPATDTVAGCMS